MALSENRSGFVGRHGWLVLTSGAMLAVLLASLASMREDVVPVRAARVERSSIRSVISTNGKVEPVQNFEAHAPINTTVRRVFVKEGDHVKKGQSLLQLDNADARSQAARAQAQLKAAQASVDAVERGGSQEELLTLQAQLVKARADRDSAQRSLDAFRRLQQKGAASTGELKEAENTLQRAQADLNLLEQKQKQRYSKPEVERVEAQQAEAQAGYAAAEEILRKSSLVAPLDGVVYSLPVKEGAYVQAGDLLLQEANLSQIVVRAYVDEPDIGRLAEGQKTEITWDALPSRVWQGMVSTIPSTVKLHGARNVGETTCLVDNHDFKLLPNTNVSVTVITAQHDNVLTIPREALRQDESKPYVYQIVGNVLQRRDVNVAASNLTRVEITNIPEDAVVALNSFNTKPLRNGIPVKVVP
ncbi:MAG TPA: efflux RND transporter periplasmic adaptor subunit [Terriglobales bacterium]|nr:efflux RND transporter periplasmic adaptor subunit [Terriglobales bacterium]